MRIGLIQNLGDIDKFIAQELSSANPSSWMQATGGNTGNVAFVQGVKNILDDDVSIVNWGSNPEWVSKNYDCLVVCCANQLGAHFDLGGWTDRLSRFELPVILFGLGAQSNTIGDVPELPDGTKTFFETVNNLRPNSQETNIVSRGVFTSSIIQLLGYESSPFGCPSQFISGQKGLGELCFRNSESNSYPRTMVAAGNPWHSTFALETILVDIVRKFSGSYVLQHPIILFNLAFGHYRDLPEAQIKRLTKMYSALGDITEISEWFSAYSIYFAEAQNWMNYAKRFSFAIGPRYHGIALPIQAGTAGTVIAIDSRTEELAETTGVPYRQYKEIRDMDSEALLSHCYWDKDDANIYDEIRERNARGYIRFMEKNGLKVSAHLKALAS